MRRLLTRAANRLCCLRQHWLFLKRHSIAFRQPMRRRWKKVGDLQCGKDDATYRLGLSRSARPSAARPAMAHRAPAQRHGKDTRGPNQVQRAEAGIPQGQHSSEGGAFVSGDQAAVQSGKSEVQGTGQEHRACDHAVCVVEPVVGQEDSLRCWGQCLCGRH